MLRRESLMRVNFKSVGLAGFIITGVLIWAGISEQKQLVPGLIGASLLGFMWASSKKNTTMSSFGPKNSVWLISQLRRYPSLTQF